MSDFTVKNDAHGGFSVAATGIGDVTSDKRGSGARFNAGKPAMELIPLRLVADSFRDPMRYPHGAMLPPVLCGLYALAEFQETGDVIALDAAIHAVREHWADCARVLDYGRRKYAAWNWAKGMPWASVIGCAGRHAVDALEGIERDAESGELHAGHFLCNLVFLRTFVDTYPEGNDLPPPELFARAAA